MDMALIHLSSEQAQSATGNMVLHLQAVTVIVLVNKMQKLPEVCK